jgi:hypothetical protein
MSERDIECPKCGRLASFLGYLNEVDIGIGTFAADPEWGCPDHGEFAFTYDHEIHRSTAVFREGTS